MLEWSLIPIVLALLAYEPAKEIPRPHRPKQVVAPWIEFWIPPHLMDNE